LPARLTAGKAGQSARWIRASVYPAARAFARAASASARLANGPIRTRWRLPALSTRPPTALATTAAREALENAPAWTTRLPAALTG